MTEIHIKKPLGFLPLPAVLKKSIGSSAAYVTPESDDLYFIENSFNCLSDEVKYYLLKKKCFQPCFEITPIVLRFYVYLLRSLTSRICLPFFFLILFLLNTPVRSIAQVQLGNHSADLSDIKDFKEKIGKRFKENIFKINGGVSVNSVYTYNDAGVGSSQPLTYIATGNVNLRIFDFGVPVSFTYSNKKFALNYTKPSISFNRLSLHPRYKNVAGHVGDFSLSFSPYTLNGIQISGGGIEYTPKKFKIQTIYGRLQKAVIEDTGNNVRPSYHRMAYGVKTLYQTDKQKVGLSVFHARDNEKSIPVPAGSANQDVKPMMGTAIGIDAGYTLLKYLNLDVEFATSILTQNLLYDAKLNSSNRKTNSLKNMMGLQNPSTSIYHAVKAGLNYAINQASIGVGYERVEPDYRTLGAYYFTNDFSNVTLNVNQSLLKGKLTMGANAGLQQEDLRQARQSNVKRMVFSGNVHARPGKKTNIGGTYSNFQSFTHINTGYERILQTSPYENLDTLDFTQVSQNASLNINHQLVQHKSQLQMMAITLSYMESANKKGDTIYKGDVTRFINGNINYSIQLIPHDLNISAAMMYTWNYAAQQNNYTMGPSLNLAKSFFKKVVRTNAGVMYNKVKGVGSMTSAFTLRFGANAVFKKRHSVNFTVVGQKRDITTKPSNRYLTASAGYSFNF